MIDGPVFALINLKAGSCYSDRAERALRAAAATAGVSIEVCRARKGKRKRVRAAVADGFRTLLAVGGDGTVSKVASEAAHHDASVGIIPAGTTNLLARELDIPDSLEEAVALAFDAPETVPVDGMRVGKHLMFSHVSMGSYSRIAGGEDEIAKRALGTGSYVARAVAEVARGHTWAFRLDVDGEPHDVDASFVMLANICPVGVGTLSWGDHITPYDGAIDVCILTADGPREHADVVGASLRGDIGDSDEVSHLTARETVSIEVEGDVPLRADGKLAGEAPVRIDIEAGATRFIVPSYQGRANTRAGASTATTEEGAPA